ncbi:hypothetical protein [Nocardia sp. NPDC003345]
MSDSSVRPTTRSVDEFIRANDPDGSLARIDSVLVEALPRAERQMWEGVFWGGTQQSIIGFGDIEQPRPRGRAVRWFLIGLARQAAYVSLYVNAVEDGRYLSQLYGARMGATRVGSASLSVRRADMGVLREMALHAARLAPGT